MVDRRPMSIWHFQFSLVPRTEVARIHGCVPSEIDWFRSLNYKEAENIKFSDRANPNYWGGKRPCADPDTVRVASLMLPAMQSWSGEALMYGEEHSHQIQIWDDDVIIRVDMRNFDLEFFRMAVGLAKKKNCLIVLHENGKVLEPQVDHVLAECKASKAWRFVQDPEGTLRAIGDEMDSAGAGETPE